MTEGELLMIPHPPQVRIAPGFRPVLAVLCLLGVSSALTAEDAPDPAAILNAARMNQSRQSAELTGQLRTAADKAPFRLTVDNGKITYQFQDPDQGIVLVLGNKDSELFERMGGRKSDITPARYDRPVRQSGITYEDLAMKFLYWPNPKLLGSDSVRTRAAWKLEMQAPRATSQYGVARVWVDKQSGALLRVEGFDDSGRLRRRFEVVSAQKVDGEWILKQMRVETFDPSTRKVVSRDYLEIDGATVAAPSPAP